MPEGSRTTASEISGGPPPWPRQLGRVALAVTLFLLGLWIARDFLVALAWAVVIAVATWPLYTRWATFHSDQGRKGLAPLLFTLLTGIALLAPLALIAVGVGREGRAILEWLNHARESGLPAPAWLLQVPLVGAQAVEWWRAHLSDPAAAGDMLGSIDKDTLTAWTSSLATQLAHRLLLVLVTFVGLFVLLHDGPPGRRSACRAASPSLSARK